MTKLLGPILGVCMIAAIPGSATAQQAPVPQSDSQAELTEARAIVDVVLPPAKRQKMFESVMESLMAQTKQGLASTLPADTGMKAILDEFIAKNLEAQKPVLQKHMPATIEAIAVAYTHEFSLAELKDIRAFATTPSGSHFLSRSSALLADPAVAKVNSEMIADSQKVSLALRDELKAKIAA